MSGLHFTVVGTGSSLVIYLRGELDLDAVEQLSLVTTAVLEDSDARHAELDLADVTFIDVVGLRGLHKLHDDARERGCELHLRPLSPQLQRIVSLCGMHDLLPAAGGTPMAAGPPRDVSSGCARQLQKSYGAGSRIGGSNVGSQRADEDRPPVAEFGPEGERVSLLFAQVAEALARSTAALLNDDPDLGQVVVEGDRAFDEATTEIESTVWFRLMRIRSTGLSCGVRLVCCLSSPNWSAVLTWRNTSRSER